MNIIELARVAGCHDNGSEFRFVELRYLERFAALVRAAALEEFVVATVDLGYVSEAYADDFAAAIRQLKTGEQT